jgi:hypothetical protein
MGNCEKCDKIKLGYGVKWIKVVELTVQSRDFCQHG